MHSQPLYRVLLKAQSAFLFFLLVTMFFHANVLLNALGGRVGVSHSTSGAGLKCSMDALT